MSLFRTTKRTIKWVLRACVELGCLPLLIIVAVISRYRRKPIDVGIGPEPLINNIYHRQALILYGYTVETFITHVYFITDEFDVRGDLLFPRLRVGRHFSQWLMMGIRTLLRYRALYFYFNGGVIGLGTIWLKHIEPFLYHLAGIKTIVMPYGGDVQDMSRSPNLYFKHTLAQDYPVTRSRRLSIQRQVDRWTRYADHVISGLEWVDYMYYWDTLTLNHFAINTDVWKPTPNQTPSEALRILHAPNHRHIKGSQFFIDAVDELKNEGYPVDLVIVEGVPNSRIQELIASVDVVADQLVIGWYASFALEGMSMGKPVLCNIREDLEDLYILAGLLDRNELPIVRCSPANVKAVIQDLVENRHKVAEIGKQSRAYVERRHSLSVMGEVFDRINRIVGILPTGSPPSTS